MAGCQPYPHPGRDRDHRGRTPLINAATAAASVAGSTAPVIRISGGPAFSGKFGG
jgi:hypothetical protein